jgi:hypothetical protein
VLARTGSRDWGLGTSEPWLFIDGATEEVGERVGRF